MKHRSGCEGIESSAKKDVFTHHQKGRRRAAGWIVPTTRISISAVLSEWPGPSGAQWGNLHQRGGKRTWLPQHWSLPKARDLWTPMEDRPIYYLLKNLWMKEVLAADVRSQMNPFHGGKSWAEFGTGVKWSPQMFLHPVLKRGYHLWLSKLIQSGCLKLFCLSMKSGEQHTDSGQNLALHSLWVLDG